MQSFWLYSLWVLAPLMQGAVAYRIYVRRLSRNYHVFLVYTIGQLLRFLVLFYCYRSGNRELYRHAYVAFAPINVVLQFAAICEIFSQVFQQYKGIRVLGWTLLRWTSLIFLFIAIVIAVYTSGQESDRFLAAFFALERSVQIVQAGLLFLLFGLTLCLGLSWKHESLGIALGFGAITAVDLITFTLRSQFGSSHQQLLSLISNGAYDLAVAIWLIAFWVRKPAHHFDQHLSSWDVASWNRTLTELLRR